jgi:hypothetical protein
VDNVDIVDLSRSPMAIPCLNSCALLPENSVDTDRAPPATALGGASNLSRAVRRGVVDAAGILVGQDVRDVGLYFLPHQSNMPPMRPPVSNAFFWSASRLS